MQKDDITKQVAFHPLLERLTKGWRTSHSDVPRDLVYRVADRLGGVVTKIRFEDDACEFQLDLSSIRLTGMDDVRCLMLGGEHGDFDEVLLKFLPMAGAAGRMGFIFTLSTSTAETVRSLVPANRFLVLDGPGLENLLSNSDPRAALLVKLRAAIERRRLIAFRIEGPVSTHMFHGLANELSRLDLEETANFVVSGPSRLGKSSLLRRFRYVDLPTKNARRALSTFYIDFYEVRNATDTDVARFIALKIDGTSKFAKIEANRLRSLLTFQRDHWQRPVDLLLDEVDSLIKLETFQVLGQAAKDGLCRLVLAGRGELARVTLQQDSPFGCRMDWIQLEALPQPSAEKLLLGGLADLGFDCPRTESVMEKASRLTGNLPHLLQFYGKELAELLIDQGPDSQFVEEKWLDRVRDLQKTAAYILSPLDDLSGSIRSIAIELSRRAPDRITVPVVRSLASDLGINLADQAVLPLCTELVMCNILAWHERAFRISNESLRLYARDLGYLGACATGKAGA